MKTGKTTVLTASGHGPDGLVSPHTPFPVLLRVETPLKGGGLSNLLVKEIYKNAPERETARGVLSARIGLAGHGLDWLGPSRPGKSKLRQSESCPGWAVGGGLPRQREHNNEIPGAQVHHAND